MAITRRTLLSGTAGACAAATIIPGCGFDVSEAPEVAATADANGKIALTLTQAAPLMAVGGAVILNVSAPASVAPGVPPGGILVARSDTNQFVAVAALCTHKGCALGYSVADKQIACPCHGSRFEANVDSTKSSCGIGAVLRGPAQQSLRAFDTTFDSTQNSLTVDLTSSPKCGGGVFTPVVANGQVVLPFAAISALSSPGGSWIGQPQGLADTLIVVRIDQTTAVALSAICTHQGCTVGYAMATNNLVCPCHGSNYDLTGKVTAGPAPTPIKKYIAKVDTQSVTVTVS